MYESSQLWRTNPDVRESEAALLGVTVQQVEFGKSYAKPET